MSDKYYVIYDGNCNLCVTFTQLLEKFDGGKQFNYVPMQDQQRLSEFDISESDCELGVILIDAQQQDRRWQGSAAIEEITHLLPGGQAFIAAYRAIPGMKNLGDRTYEQVRDNRYQWFGRRDSVYYSECGCDS
jgi:predicted DCC family thiol-disulfide oxidoreductase YuxK